MTIYLCSKKFFFFFFFLFLTWRDMADCAIQISTHSPSLLFISITNPIIFIILISNYSISTAIIFKTSWFHCLYVTKSWISKYICHKKTTEQFISFQYVCHKKDWCMFHNLFNLKLNHCTQKNQLLIVQNYLCN